MSLSLLYYKLTSKILQFKKWVILIWVAAVLAGGAITLLIMRPLSDVFEIPNTESQAALEQLQHTFPQVAGTAATVIVVAPEGEKITEAQFKEPVEKFMEQLKTQAWVESVANPYDEMTDYLISDDQQAAVISVVFNFTMFTEDPLEDQAKDGLVEMSNQLESELPGAAQVSVGGSLYSISFPELTIFELVGVIVAFLVLLMMFGTITASVIPIVSSIVALALSMILVFSMTSVENINSVTPMLALMLGLAVGIDYALFIMSKLAQHLKQGVVLDKAIMYAVSTAGGAVTFAGATVIIALIGLSLAFIPFLTIMGILAGIGVLFAVISSITFLPALLGYVGDRILSKKYRKQYRALQAAGKLKEFDEVSSDEDISQAKTPAARFYQRWFKIITRYPLVTVILIVLLLGGLSIPAKDLRLTIPEAQSLPDDNRAKITANLIEEHFTEYDLNPIMVTGSILQSNDPMKLMEDLKQRFSTVEDVGLVPIATPNQDATQGVIQVLPKSATDAPETEQLVNRLRAMHDEILRDYNFDMKITGFTAVKIDISARLGWSIIPFGIVVFSMAFILLLMIFRSLYLPLAASVGFLLSLGSALGVVTLFYNVDWLAEFIEVSRMGSIISFGPLIVMSILFGLAMDYQVFSGSMYIEEYSKSGDEHKALFRSFMNSSKVIVAAFVVMFAIFVMFVPDGNLYLKPIALCLAVGVLADAVLIRMMLMPAVDLLVGKKAFALPKFIDQHLPHVDIEGKEVARYERSLLAARADGDTVDRDQTTEYREQIIDAGAEADTATAGMDGADATHAGDVAVGAGGGAPRKSTRAKFITKTIVSLILPVIIMLGLFTSLFNPSTNYSKQPAAIVNLDEGITIEGQFVPMGRQFAQELTKNADSTYGWILTNQSDSETGLKTGKYVASVTIPTNFSTAIASFETPQNLEQAKLQVTVSDLARVEDKLVTKNFLDTAVAAFSNYIGDQFLGNLLVGFSTLDTSLGEVQDGTHSLAAGSDSAALGTKSLADGAGQLADGASELAGGTNSLAAGSKSLAGGTSSLSQGLQDYSNGTSSLSKGADALANGLKQLADSTKSLTTGVKQLADGGKQLDEASKQLTDAADQLKSGSSSLLNGGEPLTQGGSQLKLGTQSLTDALRQFNEQTQSLPDANAITQLTGGISQATAGVNQGISAVCSGGFNVPAAICTPLQTAAATLANLTDISNSLLSGLPAIKDGVAQLSAAAGQSQLGVNQYTDGVAQYLAGAATYFTGVNQFLNGVNQTVSGLTPFVQGLNQFAEQVPQLEKGTQSLADGSRSLAEGVNQLDQGAGQLSDGSKSLAQGTNSLAEGVNQLDQGAGQLSDATKQLAQGTNSLSDGLNQLSQGASQLDEGMSKMQNELPHYSDSDLKKLQAGALNPVADSLDPNTKNLNQVPLYLILALTLGAVACYLFFDPYPKYLSTTTKKGGTVGSTAATGLDATGAHTSGTDSRNPLLVAAKYLVLPAAAMIVCSVVVSTIAYYNLDMDPVSTANFYIFTALCALMFATIQQFVVGWLGRSTGTVLGICFALLVLIQWLISPANSIISTIYQFTPQKAAIETLMSFSGDLTYNYVNLLGILALLIIGYLGTSFVILRRRRLSINN